MSGRKNKTTLGLTNTGNAHALFALGCHGKVNIFGINVHLFSASKDKQQTLTQLVAIASRQILPYHTFKARSNPSPVLFHLNVPLPI